MYSPLSDAEIKRAEENTIRCLDALDKDGEAGLQRELDRIYPLVDDGSPIEMHVTMSPTPIPSVRKSKKQRVQ